MAYNQNVNTGKNPVAELFYGGGNDTNTKYFSRFIFKFDVSPIIANIAAGDYPDLTNFTHTLKMTNTSTFDSGLLGTETAYSKDRASSFDMYLFPVNQDWDEGIGYDFAGQKFFTSLDTQVVSETPSNWAEATTVSAWTNGGGVFSEWSSITSGYTQHFADGNENLELNITHLVNDLLSGGTTNYGYGLAFRESLELSVLEKLKFVGFFTRHTQTFYEPFVESIYNNQIVDNRGNFYMDKANKLYLYVNVAGVPTNVDTFSAMTVTVNDNDGDLFSAFTSSDITHESLGVYSIQLTVPTTSSGCVLYEDIWSGITINGVDRPGIELEFELKDATGYYNIGDTSSQPKREVLDSLEYRLYVKEGNAEYSVIDYQPVELAFNYNYFLLDTASLVPAEYYLDIKSTSNYEVNTIKDAVRFTIVSQVDERIG
jgi:hypothetical protein